MSPGHRPVVNPSPAGISFLVKSNPNAEITEKRKSNIISIRNGIVTEEGICVVALVIVPECHQVALDRPIYFLVYCVLAVFGSIFV